MHLHTELLEKDNSTTIHNRNIQLLATKVKNGLSLPFMNEISLENAQHYYDLRKKTEFKTMLKRCTTESKLQLF